MKALTFLARRFVAGDNVDQALEQVRRLNKEGLKVTLDNLGEDCLNRQQAAAARDEYLHMLKRIAEEKLDCNVSLKLTQFGLNLDGGLARDNLSLVAAQARKLGNFVRLDMEGSAYTQKTLDLFYELFPHYPDMGIVLQAYLRRSEDDAKLAVAKGVRVRLCKGAYKEPADIAFPDKEEVNENYDKLSRILVKAPIPAFATHDDARIAAAAAAAQEAGLPKEKYEVQMLYGLRSKRWRELRDQGHTVRVYMPYGTHWFPYFYRRVRERKENLLFVVRNLFE
mgnify:CR=1 FL=1